MKTLELMTETELSDLMIRIAKAIESACREQGLDEKPLFCLLLFNDPKITQYIGNANRKDIILAMRETADRLERREDVTR